MKGKTETRGMAQSSSSRRGPEKIPLHKARRRRDQKRRLSGHEKRDLQKARRGRDQKRYRTRKDRDDHKKKGSARGRRRKHRSLREKREELWRWREPKKRCTPVNLPPQSCCPLPLHLVVEHILSRLSVRQLCQLRCVCKMWNLVLTEGSEFLPDKAKELWFLMRAQNTNKQTGVRTFAAFSSSQGWGSPFRLPNLAGTKLSSYIGGSDWALLGDSLDCPSTHFISSAGGLICTLVQAVHPPQEHDLVVHDLMVFNCLTGSVKVLPRPPSQKRTLDGYPLFQLRMAIDNQDPYHYYVIMIDCDFQWNNMNLTVPFEVFDSRSGGWKAASSPMTKSLTGLKVVDGDLFNSLYHTSDGTMDVLAYHAAEDAWSSVQVPFIYNDPRHVDAQYPRCWAAPIFLKYKGKLFMGRMLVEEEEPVGFEVWELQFSSSGTVTLAEVARTPRHLYQPCSMTWYSLKAEASVFYLQLEPVPEGKSPPLVYDLAQNLWYVVPSGESVDCILVHRPRSSMLWYG